MTTQNKVILLLIALFTSIFSFSQGYKRMSLEEINKIPQYSKTTLGFSEDIPSSYSLERYVPEIGDQINSGSCVAWAFSYYGMSIIYNKRYDITSKAGKQANAFDPWFLYNQISYLNEDTCNLGVGELELLEISNRLGNKKMLLMPIDINCETDWENISLKKVVEYTRPYSFSDWEQIDASGDDNSVSKIKSEIFNYSYPVMIGISKYGKGLDNEKVSDGIFKPNYNDKVDDGHMMTIVGYNDNINGGSFRVVNSWGKDWGDNGSLWMSYNDYRRYTDTTFTVFVSFDVAQITDGTELDLGFHSRLKYTDYVPSRSFEGIVNDKYDYDGTGVFYWVNNDGEEEYIVGTWEDGVRDGYFLRITDEGTWYSCYENGNWIENCTSSSYGFASINPFTSNIENSKLFSSKFFNETNIEADKEQLPIN